MTDLHSLHDPSLYTKHPDLAGNVFRHPNDVRNDSRLTADEKRALLASWASDANAVPHLPALRQLPDGSIVKVDDILDTLKALDTSGEIPPIHGTRVRLWKSSYRRRGVALRKWSRHSQRPDDDDEPPPCPAYPAAPPRGGGGAAFAYSEPAPA